MDVIELVRMCVRRWWFLTPALLIVGLFAWTASASVDPEYEVTGSTLLIGPSVVRREVKLDATAEVGAGDERLFVDRFDPVNPYLSFSGSLNITAGAAAVTLLGDEFAATLGAEGYDGAYDITLQGGSPLLTVETRSDDPESSKALAIRIFEELDAVLASQQSEVAVPGYLAITTDRLTISEPIERRAARTRVLVGATGVGAAAALGLTAFVDFLLLRSRRTEPLERSVQLA